MSSINTNVSSMLARRVLGQQQSMMTQPLERLSTGVAINRGSDNPAGLIASESLRAEKAAINAATAMPNVPSNGQHRRGWSSRDQQPLG